MLLDAAEQEEVLEGLGQRAQFCWEPTPPAKAELFDRDYLALEAVLLMVASGFVGAVTTDAWKLMKRTAARVFARQSNKAYNLAPRVWFVLRDGDDQVAVGVPLDKAKKGTAEEVFADQLEERLEAMDWGALPEEVAGVRRETSTPAGGALYRAVFGPDGWLIIPWPSLDRL